MKKMLFGLPVVAGLCVMMFACNSKSKSGSGGSGDAYTLKLRLNKNDSFSHNMDMVMDMNMKIQGQEMDMKMNMAGRTDFKVQDVSGDTKTLSMTMSKMEMNSEIKTPEGMQKVPQSNIDYLLGKTITLTLDNKNTVIASSGVDSLFGENPDLDMATREQMKKMFSTEQLNSMYGMVFQMLPDKPVRVGEEWEKENLMSMGGIEMKVTTTYKLLSIKDGVAAIEMKGKINGEGSMDSQGTKLTMEIKGGQNGTMDVWQETGYLKDGKYEMDFSGNVKVMEQTVPIKVKGKYVVSDR